MRRVRLAERRSSGYSFLVELLFRLLESVARPAEVPILFVDRRTGQSKLGLGEVPRGVVALTRLRLARGRIPPPAGPGRMARVLEPGLPGDDVAGVRGRGFARSGFRLRAPGLPPSQHEMTVRVRRGTRESVIFERRLPPCAVTGSARAPEGT